MMTRPADCPRPFWNFYFNVEAIDAAKARVEAAGGEIATGPMEVPTGQWIVQCRDPQGVFFSLVAPGRQSAAPPAPVCPGSCCHAPASRADHLSEIAARNCVGDMA
jgi:hypothetical protein